MLVDAADKTHGTANRSLSARTSTTPTAAVHPPAPVHIHSAAKSTPSAQGLGISISDRYPQRDESVTA